MSSFDTQIHPEETSEYSDYVDAQELAAIEAEVEAEVEAEAINGMSTTHSRNWRISTTIQETWIFTNPDFSQHDRRRRKTKWT